MSPSDEEVLAEYVSRYDAIRAVRQFALGGPIPTAAYVITHRDEEAHTRFIRHGAQLWMARNRLEIRQILFCPPTDIHGASGALWDLNRRALGLLEHFVGDTIIYEGPGSELDERVHNEQLTETVVELEVIADRLRDAQSVVPADRLSIHSGLNVQIEAVDESLRWAKQVGVDADGPDAVRNALALEQFIQDKLANGQVMYFRHPDGHFEEVPFAPDDPPDPVGAPVR